jgi:D-xylose transport system substrate-binding protein
VRSIAERASRAACAGGAALVLAACCSCSGKSSGGGSAGTQFSLSQINNSFSSMSALKPLVGMGRGNIAVILPDTKAFAEFDAPDLAESFRKAGLKASQYTVQMPQGSAQLSAAKTALATGARVLIVDARYSGDGARIESLAKADHVPVIDYDWLTLGGARSYYVGFDSLKAGVLLGLGLVHCTILWHVKKPQVVVMTGSPDDYNAALYAQGYDAILKPYFSSGTWRDVSNPPGTWRPPIALAEFEQ